MYQPRRKLTIFYWCNLSFKIFPRFHSTAYHFHKNHQNHHTKLIFTSTAYQITFHPPAPLKNSINTSHKGFYQSGIIRLPGTGIVLGWGSMAISAQECPKMTTSTGTESDTFIMPGREKSCFRASRSSPAIMIHRDDMVVYLVWTPVSCSSTGKLVWDEFSSECYAYFNEVTWIKISGCYPNL